MKVVIFLALFALSVSAFPSDGNGRVHGENGWYVPQLDRSSFKWMSVEEWEVKEKQLQMQDMGRGLSMTPVTFYLYTNDNPKKPQKIEATTKSISKSSFNPKNPTRFVIHGWTQGYKADMNNNIRDAWLSSGDYNVIIVDWGRARFEYALAVAAVSKVGEKVAQMIDYLVKIHGMSLDNLYVIGHSLGAHVAGYTGKNTKSGQIHTIVGLDPALPLFSYKKPNKRLCDTDAFYVETIQTDGGQLGFLKPIGRGSFYPNGGKSQPGCGWDLTGACSHGRSTIYYAEAVREDNFPSMKCGDYEEAVKNDCGATFSPVRMGADKNAYMVSGDFFVPVKSDAPFGMGAEFF